MGEDEYYIRDAAWEFILEQCICKLPVDPFGIAEKNGWEVYSFLELSQKSKISIESVMKKYGDKTFVFYSKKTSGFVISFNSSLPGEEIRWNVIKEMAHIILGHVNAEVPIITRKSKEDIYLCNEDAEDFARRVICPSIVLHDCRAMEKSDIAVLCGISLKLAEKVSLNIKKLENKNKFRSSLLEIAVEKIFLEFIDNYNNL